MPQLCDSFHLCSPLPLSVFLCLPVCALTKCNAAVKNDYFMAKNTHTQHKHTCSEKYLTDTHTHTDTAGAWVLTLEKFVAHLLLAYLDAQKRPRTKTADDKRA